MIILASGSPQRRELLERLVPAFVVAPADVDETLEAPTAEAVQALALRKARVGAARAREGIVVGADTVVVIDDVALSKPVDALDARRMLRRLRGRRHAVITGVAVVDAASGRASTAAALTGVFMRDYDDAAIDAYVETGEPLDKAGAYAIQEDGGRLVAAWVGSYSNVVGLPLETTRRLLADFGVAISEPAARRG